MENISDKVIHESIFSTVEELQTILVKKDTAILEAQCAFKKQKDVIEYQQTVIENQIFEIHQLKEQKIAHRFYQPHPKDDFTIEFGNKAWRGITFRNAISTRAGQAICKWTLNKAETRSKKIIEFRQYLKDINFK